MIKNIIKVLTIMSFILIGGCTSGQYSYQENNYGNIDEHNLNIRTDNEQININVKEESFQVNSDMITFERLEGDTIYIKSSYSNNIKIKSLLVEDLDGKEICDDKNNFELKKRFSRAR